jgi:hypothetical protein
VPARKKEGKLSKDHKIDIMARANKTHARKWKIMNKSISDKRAENIRDRISSNSWHASALSIHIEADRAACLLLLSFAFWTHQFHLVLGRFLPLCFLFSFGLCLRHRGGKI